MWWLILVILIEGSATSEKIGPLQYNNDCWKIVEVIQGQLDKQVMGKFSRGTNRVYGFCYQVPHMEKQ